MQQSQSGVPEASTDDREESNWNQKQMVIRSNYFRNFPGGLQVLVNFLFLHFASKIFLLNFTQYFCDLVNQGCIPCFAKIMLMDNMAVI